jgi:hypothetical protein
MTAVTNEVPIIAHEDDLRAAWRSNRHTRERETTARSEQSAVYGTGVNFATYERCKEYLEYLPTAPIWKCLIEWGDLPGIVVPFNPEGQARCERLRLVESVS